MFLSAIRKKGIILILALIMGTSYGCMTFKGNAQAGREDRAKKVKIGLSLATLQEERWQRDRDIFVAKAKELGADVIVQTANNSNEEQIKQVKYLIDQKIDILLIVPHDAVKAQTAVAMAKKEGIYVIAYDRLVRNANVDLYISFDNVKVGEIMAQELLKWKPKGNYVILNGGKTDNNSFMFNSGFKKALGPYIETRAIDIINEIWTEDWRPEDAYNAVEKVLKSGLKPDAVIAANDSLAGAAIEALAEQRLAGKVEVAGHDADISGCQRVAEGTQRMTVYKPIDKIAQKAAELSIKMVRREQIDANSTINDGKYDVPYYMIEPIAITKENLKETVIKDGFHRLEDVFRNVPKSE